MYTCVANARSLVTPSFNAIPVPSQLRKLPMPINVVRLSAYLKDYPAQPSQDIIKGFKEGFKIPSDLNYDPPKNQYTNHRSAVDNKQIT